MSLLLPRRPALAQRAFAALERRLQKWQGKGAGGHSVASEAQIAAQLLPKEGAVVFDIGANRGLWSAALLEEARDRLEKLIAFEPSAHNWPAIQTTIHDPRFTLVREAVSDRVGSAILHMDAPGSGLASLSKRDLRHVGLEASQSEAVTTISLDAYCATHRICRIDFIKLDIEGHELAALHGAAGLLASGAIGALAFEFGGANIDTRSYFRDFWVLLGESGFAIWRLVPGSAPVPILRYHERLECFATTNYLALRQSDAQDLRKRKQPQP